MSKGNVVLKNFKGVNVDKDPRDLDDDELALTRNVYEEKEGEYIARPKVGQHSLDTDFTRNGGTGEFGRASVLPFIDEFGNEWLLIYCSDGFALENDESIQPENRIQIPAPFTGWSDVVPRPATGMKYWIVTKAPVNDAVALLHQSRTVPNAPETGRPSMVAYNGRVYVFDGQKYSGLRISARRASQPAYNASPPAAGAPHLPGYGLIWEDMATLWTGATDKPRPKVAWMYRDQMMLAGFDGTEASLIRCTDPLDPLALVSAAKAFTIGQGDGDRVMGGVEVPIEGGDAAIEPYCIVFKRNSTWMLQGPPPTSSGPATLDIKVSPLVPREGLVAKETIATTPYGVIWCSGKNVWMAPTGQKPVHIGDKIRALLKTLPQGDENSWNGVYHDGFYRLTVPCVSPSETTLTPTQQWWCDLRRFQDGGEVRWWGPMDIACAASCARRVGDGYDELVVVRTTSAQLMNLGLGDQLPAPGRDAGATADPAYEVRFKEFDFGDGMLDKIFQALEVHAWGNGDLTASILVDGGRVVTVSEDESL